MLTEDNVMDNTQLHVVGAVASPRTFTFADLAALPAQLPDVGALVPGRQGGAVRLRTLLDTVSPQSQATHLTLHATDTTFSASVPLDAVIDRAIIVYRLADAPLPASQGGPIRFLITDVEACGIAEVDACANVKYLGTIELTNGPGVDTRPTTTQEHEALHEHESS
jgi:DMSO/TMAO reductase YedYZ molybdopterin-dependent catalytic subunit